MNVIGIISSPRKNGNTETLVHAVLEGATSAGHHTSTVHLNDLKFVGCQACNYCKAHEGCKQKDDLSKVLEDIRKADAVIFSTPIYFGQLNGQFRLFEDRMFSFIDATFSSNLKPGKKAVIVTSQGNPDPKAFENASKDFGKIMSMAGFKVVDTITMSNGNNPGAVKERKDLLEEAKKVGAAL